MPIYLGTDKMKNIWLGADKVNNIWVGTDKVFSTAEIVQSISVTTQPTKRSYTAGESLNTSGIVVTATTNKGTKDVTSQCTYTVPSGNINNLQTTDSTVTVHYDTFTTTYSITVSVIYTWNKYTVNGSVGSQEEIDYSNKVEIPSYITFTSVTMTSAMEYDSSIPDYAGANGSSTQSGTTLPSPNYPGTYTVSSAWSGYYFTNPNTNYNRVPMVPGMLMYAYRGTSNKPIIYVDSNRRRYIYNILLNRVTFTKKNLVGTVTSSDINAYPSDGVIPTSNGSKNYWYVRQ